MKNINHKGAQRKKTTEGTEITEGGRGAVSLFSLSFLCVLCG
jgi:hypothetical protein